MMGPVFVRGPRPTLKDETLEQIHNYNFKGCEFKREPGGHLNGSKTLVHYKVCNEANFVAAKRIGAGGTLGQVFADGDKPLSVCCDEITESLNIIAEGREITPVTLFQADPRKFMEMQGNLYARYNPLNPLSTTEVKTPQPKYPLNFQILCDRKLLYRGMIRHSPTGYMYKAPYLTAMIAGFSYLLLLIYIQNNNIIYSILYLS
jgi:hypothetical protein